MAYVTAEKNVKLRWLPGGVSDEGLAVVSASELEASVPIKAGLLSTGIGVEFTQNEASAPLVDSGKIVKAPGTSDASITLTSLRDSDEEADVIWEMFEQGDEGDLIVSRFGEPEAGSRIEVYRCVSFDPVPVAPSQDDFQQSQVRLSPNDWNLKSTVGS